MGICVEGLEVGLLGRRLCVCVYTSVCVCIEGVLCVCTRACVCTHIQYVCLYLRCVVHFAILRASPLLLGHLPIRPKHPVWSSSER